MACSGCRVSFGCPFLSVLWQQCSTVDPPCAERYCIQCTLEDGWQCAQCEYQTEDEIADCYMLLLLLLTLLLLLLLVPPLALTDSEVLLAVLPV